MPRDITERTLNQIAPELHNLIDIDTLAPYLRAQKILNKNDLWRLKISDPDTRTNILIEAVHRSGRRGIAMFYHGLYYSYEGEHGQCGQHFEALGYLKSKGQFLG